MSVFKGVARPAILAASRSHRLRHMIERVPVTQQVVHRFVPGERVSDALDTVVLLSNTNRYVSIDYLGEDVVDADTANATVAAYLDLLGALGPQPGAIPLQPEVSLKLSALGQALPRDGEKIALENAHVICAKARDLGILVTIDAEDHTTTDSTLSIVRELHADFDWLGTVLQAYLKRTQADCQDLAGTRIRLCKGAYDEPPSVAFRDRDDITDNYLRCLRVLMAGSGYPMVASHDPVVIEAVPDLVAEFGRRPDDFEYQMLYGIRDDEQRRLAEAGNRVRVYVPFGSQWYGYFVRRLAERPANLTFFLRALASH
ncbi:proline dehydrogenase family protein [Mycobacterium sp. OTB74]|uniref:proline dehydrogenase family protein n=1 Tax=Mycobacterium sp. OTB74 TaxID=1853452 RepID=UPI0024731DC7|nr:proline dehydrogenase family protein [Mycobacterium sp. OTB74]MDH6244593.1 proline dehydrogenase [Mycobacterium sp. OTB74]